jgi:hypothetical protein
MPRRRRTRAQHRAQAIAAERSHNRQTRQGRRDQLAHNVSYPEDPDDPPPF